MDDNSHDIRKRLEKALDSDPDNPAHHYNLGLFLWEKGEDKERAAEHLVLSVKLNPSNGAAFRLLGHYYSRVSVDLQRASKCYQRAVTLNPDDFESGEALCDLLDEGGKESLEVAICREASEKSPRAFWAWRRLGYMQALGLAYQRLGMFTAAIKSYGRAIELEDSRVFALVESGNILLMLGSCRKGIDQFRQALKFAPHNVAAHYGLASGLLGLSRDCVNSGAFAWGASLLEEASDIVRESSCLAGNVCSIWKLHGDIQIAYAKCFPWADEGQRLEIDVECFRTSINSWKRKCLSAAISANRSYQRALHLTPWQANIYTDIAISLDLTSSLDKKSPTDENAWQLPEKMSLGALILEGNNNDFWVVLGCLSTHKALKQHALIRGLQLDVSLAAAWAYLGKLYREEGQKLLARQAFDHARSIDPSLALPWAGMAMDAHAGECSPEEAYESCLRAVQISTLAEFQIGLGKLAALSGHLLCPQVFGAVKQAVRRAPHYPEAHNLNGLVCEARLDFQSAIAAYKLARCAIGILMTQPKSHIIVVSVNLARSLCRAGHALDAARECENLKNEGFLDSKGLQIYAVALWQLGENDRALSMARSLIEHVSTMNRTTAAASIGLVCKLIYRILGSEPAGAFVLKMHRELLQSSKNGFIVLAIGALDLTGRLQLLLPKNLHSVASNEEAPGLQSLNAICKLISPGSKQSLEVQSGIVYLRKALHIHPQSSLLRNHLGSLLLSSGDWKSSHTALRCVASDQPGHGVVKGSKSACEILGCAVVACYASCATQPKFSFPACKNQTFKTRAVHQLQKWLHQEPWNHKAQYLLLLSLLQKAREEKFPRNLCATIKHILFAALSNEIYEEKDQTYQYLKFQLLLCASEISLQTGDYCGCIDHATNASRLSISNGATFFAHLQLCRAYAAYENLVSLKDEYTKCLHLRTDYEIGWISLKFLESKFRLQDQSSSIDLNFEACLKENGSSSNRWVGAFDLICAQSFLWDRDFHRAEQALSRACSTGQADACLFLTHGAICMVLARQKSGSQFLSLAVRSLAKAQEAAPFPFPVVSALLAQAEASLGARTKWERNLHLEWFSWPAEMRPAELYFQMHLLARQPRVGPELFPNLKSSQSPQRWILRAVHLNPSCLRYWKVLEKLKE